MARVEAGTGTHRSHRGCRPGAQPSRPLLQRVQITLRNVEEP